jgi:hypothetical protein
MVSCVQITDEARALKEFVEKHGAKISGVLSCPDRVVFKGYLPIGYGQAMESFMMNQGFLIKEFKEFVTKQTERLSDHAKAIAGRANRPYLYLYTHRDRKDDMAEEIARKDRVTSGLICVFGVVEPCQSFVLAYGQGRPRLVGAQRKCLCFYYYFIDREWGMMHVRIQSWFPMNIQICVNGHEWLARKMDRHGIAYEKIDNAFAWIEDVDRAQRFAEDLTRKRLHRKFNALARRVNPLMSDLLEWAQYYWVIDQYEFSTDIMFKDRNSLEALFPKLLKHAAVCFSAEDVLTFLGRRLHPNFKGEVLNDCKKRPRGARVKHRMKANWIKMYDKHGLVLRIETVINHPYEFKVRRKGKRKGEQIMGWFPMAKGVANFPRFAEVCLIANKRYLQALSVVDDPTQAYHELDQLCEPARLNGRRRRGLNPLRRDDVALFTAVLRGEHAIHGFSNRDLFQHLFPNSSQDPVALRRTRARVTRLIQLLRAHKLIAKIPRSRRYRLTLRGLRLISAVLYLRKEDLPETILALAA